MIVADRLFLLAIDVIKTNLYFVSTLNMLKIPVYLSYALLLFATSI